MFNVIVDTKEKYPWHFTSMSIGKVVKRGLKTGDYTIEGLEDKLCIERKRTVSEFAINATEDRFERELQRMKQFPHSVIICEFDMADINVYPVGSTVPKKHWKKLRVRGPFIKKRMSEIIIQHQIPIILAHNADDAAEIATSLMKRIYEKYGR